MEEKKTNAATFKNICRPYVAYGLPSLSYSKRAFKQLHRLSSIMPVLFMA